jgi:uncharacterized OB-fold protein
MVSPLFRLDDGHPALLGTRCTACDYCWFPPNEFGCERCGAFGGQLAPIEFSGRGRLLAFTSVPDAGGAFILGKIVLDEGPVLRGVVQSAAEELVPGDSLEAFPVTVDDQISIRFRKAHGHDV